MRNRRVGLLSIILMCLCMPHATAQSIASAGDTHETSANSMAIPKLILKTGVRLDSPGMSPNTLQLANNIGITPILERIQTSRTTAQSGHTDLTLESLNARQDLYENVQKASLIIQKTNLEVDFTIAEIDAERMLYDEMLTTFTNDRDKLVARINAASFISNGILWAACEGLDIPTYRSPRLSVPSGTLGILAGVVPSIASMYTLKAVNGKKKTSEVDPNMLAKLFGYPTNPEIEYPSSVWRYLHQEPADGSSSKIRLDQIIDRWIADSNMSAFTDRQSKKQLDVMTASVAERKGLSISSLTSRIVMLQQLQTEIIKIKRMLLELALIVDGDKQFIVDKPARISDVGIH